jgi:hypothetical protein
VIWIVAAQARAERREREPAFLVFGERSLARERSQ